MARKASATLHLQLHRRELLFGRTTQITDSVISRSRELIICLYPRLYSTCSCAMAIAGERVPATYRKTRLCSGAGTIHGARLIGGLQRLLIKNSLPSRRVQCRDSTWLSLLRLRVRRPAALLLLRIGTRTRKDLIAHAVRRC